MLLTMSQIPEVQLIELEALESIYCNELSVVSRNPAIKFTMDLHVDEDVYEEEVSDDEKYWARLWFQFTPNYPNEVPLFGIEDSNNLFDEDITELISLLTNESNNLLGTEMIFLLVSTAKEWLNTRKDESAKRKEEQIEKKKREIEEAEMKRFEGTRVTVDSFMKWKLKFDAEMAITSKRSGEKERESNQIRKLSGRELFEKDSTLNESDLKFLEEDRLAGGKEISYDMAGVAVDTTLFDDMDDDDDDDDEDWVPE